MRHVLYLAWRYVTYHKVKSGILTVCLTLTIVLPLATHLLIAHYGAALTARAEATPLVLGARGNRFDLVLKALYFGSAQVDPVYLAAADEIRDSGLAAPIPLHLKFTARGHPIVGTSLEYFDFRGLRPAAGTLPVRLGQAVLGAGVAAALRLRPGDALFSDQRSLYDITRTYPLKMHVCGVLAPSGTPDDDAVFVDVKTAWIIEGISHGHQDVTREGADENVILQRTQREVRTNASIFEYNEVTPENIDSFHTHAAPDALPLSAVLVVPDTEKSATILKARFNQSDGPCRMLVPRDVIDELLGLVFRIKRFFDASFALVAGATLLFLVLVVLLSLRLRQREIETMFKLGCSRGMVFRLHAAELAIILVISGASAGALALAVLALAPRWLRLG